ncbi:MAG: hypothetical protein LBS35_06780 [Synergistaceae bacterium]|jgi:hypothetical protein|nr:hypothetical protein [Synergistaceae bacterium]
MKRKIPAVAISIAVSLTVGFLCGFFSGYTYASKTIVCEIPAEFFQPRDIPESGVSQDQNLGVPPQTRQGD